MNISPFGEAFHDQALAMAQVHIADAALHFIGRGLSDPYGQHADSAPLATFALAVRGKLLDAVAGHIVPTAEQMARTWHKDAWPQAQAQAHRALLGAFASTRSRRFGRIAPPRLVPDGESEAALAREVCGAAPADAPTDANPLQQAFALARFNALRCEQRITLLQVLADLIRLPSTGALSNAAAQTEYANALRELWVRRALHLSRALAFGTLLGGEYLESNKTLVKEMYGEGMSVIELLQVDGELPSRWQAGAEDELRAALSNA